MEPQIQWMPWSSLTRDALYALMVLRQRVFVVEQRCCYQDADGRDPLAHHLLAWRAGELVACLRVFPPDERGEITVGRVVTAPEIRGTGFGRPLVGAGLDRARDTWGPHPAHLSAQAHLEPFYASLGFAACGPGYDEDGIPHLPMRRP